MVSPHADVWEDVLREDSDRIIRPALSPSGWSRDDAEQPHARGLMGDGEVGEIVEDYARVKWYEWKW